MFPKNRKDQAFPVGLSHTLKIPADGTIKSGADGLTLADGTFLPIDGLRSWGPLFGWFVVRGEAADGDIHTLFMREEKNLV